MIDLHRHLDGSLRLSTLQELAVEQGIVLPFDKQDILFYKGMGLNEALGRFALTLSVLQTPEAVCRVASEICDDAKTEGVTDLEIRFAPQLHRGANIESIVDAALMGTGGRAGIILCGLYGEAPELLHKLVDVAANRNGVCGIDLAGGPAPQHQFSMIDYVSVFQRAEKMNLGRTVHAGEGRSPDEIIMAVTKLRAQRIGHGTTLLESPEALDLVRENGIVIEACPTSNVHTGVIETIEEHPIAEWIEQEVLVSICTDNTLLSNIDAPTEYQKVLHTSKMNEDHIQYCLRAGRKGLFSQ